MRVFSYSQGAALRRKISFPILKSGKESIQNKIERPPARETETLEALFNKASLHL